MNSFAGIEDMICKLIRNELLGPYLEEKKEQYEKFNSKILYTSWFSFHEKRKLVIEIINAKERLTPSRKKEIEYSIRRIMSYRNMMAHGKFYTDGKISKLEYYEGELKFQILNDEFWEKLEKRFQDVFYFLRGELKHRRIYL